MYLSTSALLVLVGGGSLVFSVPLQGWAAPILSNNSGVGQVLKTKIFIAPPPLYFMTGPLIVLLKCIHYHCFIAYITSIGFKVQIPIHSFLKDVEYSYET